MTHAAFSRRRILLQILTRLPFGIGALLALILIPAGTWRFVNAWYTVSTFLICASILIAYFLLRAPDVIERRLQMKERDPAQRRIMLLAIPHALISFSVPGLDFRSGWSHVPLAVALIGDALIIVAYALFFEVLRENRWAGRTIAVEEGQSVVSTGFYGIVRHPMYVSMLVMYTGVPLALGSWWAAAGSVGMMIPILYLRITSEEAMLARDLAGYAEYTQRVRYRLFPGLW